MVTATGTQMGKTWVSAAALRELRSRAMTVTARKPVQSFAVGDVATDAEVLGEASGEPASNVCPPHRSYATAMAPPMAAAALGQPLPTLAELVREVEESWPIRAVDVGLLEAVGGVASPLAIDGDSADLAEALSPDHVVLVAQAGLGTINLVRLSLLRLARFQVTVHLNRFDANIDLHTQNRDWLRVRDGVTATTTIGELIECLQCPSGHR